MSRFARVRIVATLTIMAMLASPITHLAAAQDVTCEEGQVVDEETGECVDTPVEEDGIVDDVGDEDAGTDPVDDAAIDDGGEADEEPSGETIANVYLLGLACPADWDFATRTLDDAYATCSGGGDATWSILRDGATVATVGVGEQADLATMGADLSPGAWAIEPSGGDAGYADCVVYDSTGATTNSVSQPVDSGISFDLIAGDTLDCDWFVANGPAADDEEATNQGLVAEDDGEEAEPDPVAVGGAPINSLTFTVVACPYSIENIGPSGNDACNLDTLVPVSFQIAIDGTIVATGTGGGADRNVTFTTPDGGQIPSGEWEVRLTTSTGYEEDDFDESQIVCVTTTAGGTASPVVDSSIMPYLEIFASPRDDTVCKAYMTEAQPREGATGAITFTASQCPAGVTPTTGNEQCTLPLTMPVPVGIELIDGASVGTHTLTAAAPTWTVPTVPVGTMRFYVDVPDTFVPPSLYCSTKNFQGTPFVPGGVIPRDGTPGYYMIVGIGQTVTCTIVVSTDTLSSRVTNTVFTCPPGTDPAALSATERTTECTTTAGITIDNTVNGSPYTRVKTAESGTVNHALAAGQNTLTLMNLPEGTVARYVTCDLMPAGGTRQSSEPEISGGTAITVKLLQNDNVSCDWYLGDTTATQLDPVGTDPTPTPTQPPAAEGDDDSPAVPTNGDGGGGSGNGGGTGGSVGGTAAESPGQTNDPEPIASTNDDATGQPSTIVIRAWTCDETVDPTSSFEQLATACTAIDGDASWTIGGFQPGNLTIQLATEGDPVAFCSVDATDDAFDTFPEPAVIDLDGVLAVSVPPSATVFCDWFQFPAA